MKAPACIGATNASTASGFCNTATTSVLAEDALLVTGQDRFDCWNNRIDELLAIRLLPDDWDGQGSTAPATDLVDSALMLARSLRQGGVEAPSRIVPGVNGSVIFEWQGGEEYCEIEVTRPYHAEGMRLVPGQPPEHWLIQAE